MAYCVMVRAKVKADYETGNFSVEQLLKRYGIAAITIEKRIGKEKWIKGASKKAIEEKIQETTEQMFARLGLPKEKVLKKVMEGLEAEKVVITGGKEDAFAEVMPDHLAVDKFVTQYNKMVGGYAAEKQEIKQESDIKLKNEDLSKLSTDELNIMLKLIGKVGGE